MSPWMEDECVHTKSCLPCRRRSSLLVVFLRGSLLVRALCVRGALTPTGAHTLTCVAHGESGRETDAEGSHLTRFEILKKKKIMDQVWVALLIFLIYLHEHPNHMRCSSLSHISNKEHMLLPGRGSLYIWSINTHALGSLVSISFLPLISLSFSVSVSFCLIFLQWDTCLSLMPFFFFFTLSLNSGGTTCPVCQLLILCQRCTGCYVLFLLLLSSLFCSHQKWLPSESDACQ